MPIVYRPARADELQATQELIVGSINDLTERHGFGAMATVRSPEFQLFSLNSGLHVWGGPRAFDAPPAR